MRGVRDSVDWIVGFIPPVDGLSARPRRIDLVLAAVLAAASVAEFPFLTSPFPGFALAAGLVWAVAAAFRRVRPLLAVAVATAVAVSGDLLAWLTDEPLLGTFGGGIAVLVILYSTGRWAPPNTVILSLVLAGIVLPTTGFLNPENDPAWAWFLVEVVVTTAAIGLGVLIRSQQVLKTEQARAELAEERNHLANDIHDSVAHHMSAIAVRAEGARQLTDPAQRDEALDAIRQSASTGLSDVRHLISTIRNTDDMPRPLPGLGDLKQLANESTTPSLRVDVVIDASSESIPVTVAAVAYLIAREALTNVRRHATGATEATVRAGTTDGFLGLTITDDGVTPATRTEAQGFGIRVMTERADSVGGDLSAGPNPTGGWLVAARLPLTKTGTGTGDDR